MAGQDVQWGFYDRERDAEESRRNLPHIDMPGALTFVTFRLKDSMPAEVVKCWHDEIDSWLNAHGFRGQSVESVLTSSSINGDLKRELNFFKHRRWHGHLDACHGKCILRDAELRDEVSQSLLHFNGERYDVERFVIMPNHVHVLIQMRTGFGLRKQFREIQRYSAREINKRLGQSGDLWQGEPFDHIVRSETQFEYLQNYINDNPKKANLSEGEYTLWVAT